MPQSIPNDPSLSIGSVVPQEKLEILIKIADEQAKIDAAEDALNSQIQLKRSLDMTIQDLLNMGIDPSEETKAIETVKKSIMDAAKAYATVKIATLPNIIALKSQLGLVSAHIESPVDFNKSSLKTLPLSYDSLKLNAQYFSFDENDQSAHSQMASIKAFVSNSTEFLGDKFQEQATTAVQEQISSQRQNHDIEGTLIITAVCTNKNAVLIAPFILDVDKAIRVWNFSMPKDKMIKTNDVQNMAQISAEEGTAEELSLNILSSVNYGSSFIGMVHILRAESTESDQKMASAAASMQTTMEIGSWFANESGGAGVDASFASDVKNLLSQQNITSHISLITVGSIPSVKSNSVKLGVQQFSDFSPDQMMKQLAVLQNANAGEKDTVSSSADKARVAGQLQAMQSTKIQSVMSGLAAIDDGQNKMLDINSLMTAFEDYLDKALAGNIGVPISYGLKPITRAQLAQMWMNKYYHGRYLGIAGDDSTSGDTAAQGKPAQSSAPNS
jgi:hypothetical protein